MSDLTGFVVLAQTAPVDQLQLNFNTTTIWLLNIILGFIMFGIALDVKVEDLRAVIRNPRGPIIGVLAQFLALPALTFLLTQIIDPAPSIALGMILVGSCPGGNISNFITHIAKGNTMLSIGMTAVSTIMATVMTPLNFAFWGSLDTDTKALLTSVAVDPVELVVTISLLLGVPVALGMMVRARRPALAERIYPIMRRISIGFFILFVVAAFAANFQNFLDYIGLVLIAVFLHNAIALGSGYGIAAATGMPEYDRRAISIEVGIQNSALALVLIFGFFDGLGGMALVAAWWGVWHIISGLTMARFWGQRPTPHDLDEVEEAAPA